MHTEPENEELGIVPIWSVKTAVYVSCMVGCLMWYGIFKLIQVLHDNFFVKKCVDVMFELC